MERSKKKTVEPTQDQAHSVKHGSPVDKSAEPIPQSVHDKPDDEESSFEPMVGFGEMIEDPNEEEEEEEEDEEEGEEEEEEEKGKKEGKKAFAKRSVMAQPRTKLTLTPSSAGAVAKGADESLKLIKEVIELGKNGVFEGLVGMTQSLTVFSQSFAFVGAVIGIVNAFLPDKQFRAIMREFQKLHAEIGEVRRDIRELEQKMTWESAQIQYANIVSKIQLGMDYCQAMDKNRNNAASRRNFEERLKALCEDQSYLLGLRILIEGLTGQGEFRISILDSFYDYSGGDRPKMSQLGSRLLQLLGCGLIALSAYETMVRGESGANDIDEMFRRDIEKVGPSIKKALNRCTKNFKVNMQNDVEKVVAENRNCSNRTIVNALSQKLSEKFDWLRIFCVVYDDITGFHKHTFGGFYVTKLHFHGKCATAFYMDKKQPIRQGYRESMTVKAIIEEASSLPKWRPGGGIHTTESSPWKSRREWQHAEKNYRITAKRLETNRIGWWGLGCIKRHVGLESRSTGGVRHVWEVRKNLTYFVLLR